MPQYKVMVDDNFHYQEPEERRVHGIYATLEEALAVCRGLVDQALKEEYRPGISAEKLYERYTSFGDDPFIVVLDGADNDAKFSAWNYAKERCRALCGDEPPRAGSASRA
ncbi:MAG: hypothetical protein ACLQME_11275 [Alphaproteobacteria bacterium]